ncbi:DUF4436 domain-containing protein [Mycobacterium sp.]|uniref:DUF4436 domain-containing protein n=1 Tax=Mycobacterium sp. TaxID=1785 RepID=UPI002C266BE0|nr:DUF4436 domain-containing protein [Mycobacterium sp.]HTQ19195.1 DUF4436 domain-containing protein [Mycobacterium sp.]
MPRRRLSIVGILLFVAAYIGSIVLYIDSGVGHPHLIRDSAASKDATAITIDVQDIQSTKNALHANLSVAPAPALLDPQNHSLKEDLSVVVTSAISARKQTWLKGTLPDVFPVSLTLVGDVADWPFDTYRSGLVSVELLRGDMQVREPATVTLVDRLLAWKVDVIRVNTSDTPAPYRVDLRRSRSTAAFGVVILAVLVTLAGLGLFVAIQTLHNRRKFQPPMTTWYAAMLFAVMPLRGALPDSPPFGSWIDVTIVLWVIVVLVISMTIYITCWWRHLRPDIE